MKNLIKSKEEIGCCLCVIVLFVMVVMLVLVVLFQDVVVVSEVLMGRFDWFEVCLQVVLVVVVGDYVLVGWRQGECGGCVLLYCVYGCWQIVVCGGDVLKEMVLLCDVGVFEVDVYVLVCEMEWVEQQELLVSQC